MDNRSNDECAEEGYPRLPKLLEVKVIRFIHPGFSSPLLKGSFIHYDQLRPLQWSPLGSVTRPYPFPVTGTGLILDIPTDAVC